MLDLDATSQGPGGELTRRGLGNIVLAGTSILAAPPARASAEARAAAGRLASMHRKTAKPVDLLRYKPAIGSDITIAWLEACAEARELDTFVLLPPHPVQISQTGVVRGIIGVPGKSKLILSPNFTTTGFNNQFCILNPHFSQAYDEATADIVLFSDFDIETSPNTTRSILGLANVRSGLIERVNITAHPVIIGGQPVPVDSLIDFYAAAKRVTVSRCSLNNITGAYGATKVSAGGGGTIWVRNISSDGSMKANTTEDIDISHNIINHRTSDEAIAVFGCRGVTRRVKIRHNIIRGLDSRGAYHPTLISVFPLDDGSGPKLGDTAAVFDNEISENDIEDRSFLYSVIRIGNTADAARSCHNNRTVQNRIKAYRSKNGHYGPKATWEASGSTGTDPDKGSWVLRCIEGRKGEAYTGAVSGNLSDGDRIRSAPGSAQIAAAIVGFQKVINPTVIGANIFTGVAFCQSVSNGSVEAFARAFYNVHRVTGSTWRVLGSGSPAYATFYIDSADAGSYAIRRTRGASASGFVFIGSGAAADTLVVALSNSGRLGSAVALNIQQASATLSARANNFSGAALKSVSNGKGSIHSQGNRWADRISD